MGFCEIRSRPRLLDVFAHVIYGIPEFRLGTIGVGPSDLPRSGSKSLDGILTGD